jgi:glycosyltransferase involved in cell wall biosynthesis
MKVLHVTFSESGGAGIVAKSLSQGLIDCGVDSKIVSMTHSGIPNLAFSNPVLVIKALFDFFIVRRSVKNSLFTLFRKSTSQRIRRLIPKFDLVHLHWISGALNYGDIVDISDDQIKVVWTLHDMWPFTGGCHHSYDCKNYEVLCNECPQVRPIFHRSVESALANKVIAIRGNQKLAVVAPSKWLADRAKKSQVFNNSEVYVIPNPVDEKVFRPGDRRESRKRIGIDDSVFVVGCSAKNLHDTQKNIKEIVLQLEEFVKEHDLPDVVLIAIGGGQLESDVIKIFHPGFVDSSEVCANLYQAMDVFVSLSLAENLPLTLIEASSSGVPIICLDRGGMAEVVIDQVSGFVISDSQDFKTVLCRIIYDEQLRNSMAANARFRAVDLFSSNAVANQYKSIYESLM